MEKYILILHSKIMQHNYQHGKKIKASEEDIYAVHEYDLDLKANHIYLQGIDRGYEVETDELEEPGVDFVMANRFIRNINLCARMNQDRPILILMKTCGGSYQEGMAIYDAIKACPSRVIILNYTHARSMSSIILQAADKRIMMPHSHFMFHKGTMSLSGTVKSVESNIKFSKHETTVMLDIYAESMKEKGKLSNKTMSQIKKWLNFEMDKKEDVFLTAKQTIEYGLADEIFDSNWTKIYD